jgi:hypothetical protein
VGADGRPRVYRIYGLPPGDYYVSSMMRAARANDVSALTTAQVDDALAALQRGITAAPQFMPRSRARSA